MNTRRRLLTCSIGIGTVFLSGCIFESDTSYPINMIVQNARQDRFSAEIQLTDENDDTLFESELVIPPSEGDRVIMRFEDVARVSDEERVTAEVRINGNTHEAQQEVTCRAGTPTNMFRFVIYSDEDAFGGDGMRLQALSSGAESC